MGTCHAQLFHDRRRLRIDCRGIESVLLRKACHCCDIHELEQIADEGMLMLLENGGLQLCRRSRACISWLSHLASKSCHLGLGKSVLRNCLRQLVLLLLEA